MVAKGPEKNSSHVLSFREVAASKVKCPEPEKPASTFLVNKVSGAASEKSEICPECYYHFHTKQRSEKMRPIFFAQIAWAIYFTQPQRFAKKKYGIFTLWLKSTVPQWLVY